MVSAKWRIYRRIGSTRHDRLHFPVEPPRASPVARVLRPSQSNPARLAALAQHALLQRYAPACVIINRSGEMLYFQGRTDDYLVPEFDEIGPARGTHSPVNAKG